MHTTTAPKSDKITITIHVDPTKVRFGHELMMRLRSKRNNSDASKYNRRNRTSKGRDW